MPICINQNGDVFDEFLPVSEEEANLESCCI
jgi:hypothetical protein